MAEPAPAGTVLPESIEPMLAQGGGQPFDNADFGFEIKWDGLRCLAIGDQAFRLQNRHLKVITHQFPELDFDHLPEGTVLDGEVIVLKRDVPSFQALQRRAHLKGDQVALGVGADAATFMAFDLIYEGGRNITGLPLSARRERLEALLAANPHDRLVLTDQVIGRGRAYFEAVAARNLEGLIAKRLDARYLEGRRSSAWTKIVAWRIDPFQVLGFVKEPDSARVKSVIVGRRGEDGWVCLGRVGALPDEDCKLLYQALKDAPPLTPPPGDPPPGAIWRQTDLRCFVRYFQESATGRLRLPRFRGWASK